MLADALAYMNSLISKGWEYPDAKFRASQKYKVDYKELAAAYDAQFQR